MYKNKLSKSHICILEIQNRYHRPELRSGIFRKVKIAYAIFPNHFVATAALVQQVRCTHRQHGAPTARKTFFLSVAPITKFCGQPMRRLIASTTVALITNKKGH
ncbi:MAG: hypothetical protein LBV68_06460 [Spirochaetaceae bacterium]|nr:hypothetical protein [Spirochaetaceae bacterium]